MLMLPLKPHFPAALLMFTLVSLMAFEPSLDNRILYAGAVTIAFTAFLILFGVEYEIAGRAGWRKHAEMQVSAAKAGQQARKAEKPEPADKKDWIPRVRLSGRLTEATPEYG